MASYGTGFFFGSRTHLSVMKYLALVGGTAEGLGDQPSRSVRSGSTRRPGRNGTLTSIEGYRAADADVAIVIDRAELEPAITGQTTLAALLQSGHGTVAGNVSVLRELESTLEQFDPRSRSCRARGNRSPKAGTPVVGACVDLVG